MRRLIISAIVLSLSSTVVDADGLIYQLPEDGTSVDYEMEMTVGLTDLPVIGDGTLSVSSVGQAVVDNEKCRWLEFKMKMNLAGREQTVINKLLIPEKHLGRGKSPIDHVKKCWLKKDDGEAHEVEDAGQLSASLAAFLSGPLKHVKKLKQEDVKSKLGELACEGSTGQLKFKRGDNDIAGEIEVRLHDKAPFGVVMWTMELGMFSRDGLLHESTYMTLKLAKIDKNAKSELPNVN